MRHSRSGTSTSTRYLLTPCADIQFVSVFAAAAKTITIKVHGDSDASVSVHFSWREMPLVTDPPQDNDDADSKPSGEGQSFTITRTTTGIISNRRPTTSTNTPGDSTPELISDASASVPAPPRGSLMAIARREGAKRALYARFYRGPVIGTKDLGMEVDAQQQAKRKRSDSASSGSSDDEPADVGTRWKNLAAVVTLPKSASNAAAASAVVETDGLQETEEKAARRAAKAERKALRAERRAARAEKREKKQLKREMRDAAAVIASSEEGLSASAVRQAPPDSIPALESEKKGNKKSLEVPITTYEDSNSLAAANGEVLEKRKSKKRRKAECS